MPCSRLQIIVAACQDHNADVRQSGFALVGDLARGCISHLLPAAPQLVSTAVATLAPQAIKEVGANDVDMLCGWWW